MTTYLDVYIASQTKSAIVVSPDPCVVDYGVDGILFKNLTASAVTVDMSGVPGFKTVAGLQVSGNGSAVAPADKVKEVAGVFRYSIALSRAAGGVTGAAPRVILDI